MKMKVHCIIVIIFATANAKPFLYNTGQVLSQAIASSSSPQQSSNIADLRKAKVQQLEKQTVADDSSSSFFDNMDGNEASPGLFQKKIAKIVAKLQLLSSLSTGFGNGGANGDGGGDLDPDLEIDVGSENSTSEATTVKYNETSSSSNQFERLRMFEEDVEPFGPLPGAPTAATRFSLGRFLGSVIHLAYRMMNTNRNNNQSIVFETTA